MPPAFNLSQDQTLQFDLDKLLKELTQTSSGFHTRFHPRFNERLKSFRLRLTQPTPSDQPGSPEPSPSNAHTYRLSVFKELAFRLLAETLPAKPCIMPLFFPALQDFFSEPLQADTARESPQGSCAVVPRPRPFPTQQPQPRHGWKASFGGAGGIRTLDAGFARILP